jgi:KipI family sensor histidine kinase inhibitor
VAVSIELGDEISADLNTRVRALEYLIQQKGLPGVLETVPTYRALLVYYDPSTIAYRELVQAIAALVPQAQASALPPARLVELPVEYGGDLGFDLEAVAARLRLTPDDVVRLHAGAEYLVYFIGFTPGLPYMAGMPERLTIPRLDQPRLRTPPGSVAIGGTQCCIYSVESPGGFWVLGRTPVPLYDPGVPEPILLKPGDRVRFRAIEGPEYDAITTAVAAGRFVPVIT